MSVIVRDAVARALSASEGAALEARAPIYTEVPTGTVKVSIRLTANEVRRLEERVRELERILGRKTLEVEILKEALDLARAKKAISLSSSAQGGGSR